MVRSAGAVPRSEVLTSDAPGALTDPGYGPSGPARA